MKKGYIYVIENTINEKVYVGKTNNPDRRWNDHKAAALINENGKSSQTKIHRAMRKHGIENFSFRIIDEHYDEEIALKVLEPMWIEKYKLLGVEVYNSSDGGLGIVGYNHTQETKNKIREGNKGKVISQEQREKISESLKGNVISLETRKKISESLKGKKKPPFTIDHLEKIRKANRGKKKTPEMIEHLRHAMKTSTKVGHAIDEETRKKISESLKGQIQSKETKDKRSESMKKYHQKRREELKNKD